MRSILFSILFFIVSLKISSQEGNIGKINGVNFVSPKFKSKLTGMDSVKSINANWIALCPFALLEKSKSKIEYNTSNNWWGDSKQGLIEEIKKAKILNLKVLIKPHFWVKENGWAGDFDLSGKLKMEWESNYRTYLLYLARLCDSLNVEMLCIGTELKVYTEKHPEFFTQLIDDIRKAYKGKLTYAANWDEYTFIKFWDKLDFISIDAYFPLSSSKTPEVKELELEWKKIAIELKNLSARFNKKIIFTEYGYKSINCAANKQWEFENVSKTENINFQAQVNAYTALYNTIWKESYIAGGFLWKWYNECDLNKNNSDYTPQYKPVNYLIRKQYSLK